MQLLFSIFRIDIINAPNFYRIHGRTLEQLTTGQSIYLNNSRDFPCKIIKIVAYGVDLKEIEKAMGCAIDVELNCLFSQNIKQLEGVFLWG